MAKRVVPVVIVALFFLLAGYLLLQSAWLPRFLLSRMLAERIPGARLESFSCQEHHLNLSGKFSCQGGDLSILREQERYQLRWDDFKIKKTEISVKKLSINSSSLRVKDLAFDGNFNLKGNQLSDLKGRLRAASVNWSDYQIENLASSVEGDVKTIRFPDFRAAAYDGLLKGQIFLDYAPELAYSIQLEFEGGKVKASWLTPLIQYIPQSSQKKELEALIKAGGDIPVEKVFLKSASVDEENLSTAVLLKSARLNLDLNLSLDIHVDGGIKEILRYLQMFSK